jgi:predicted metal-dependent phosphotriesterase family hydrolase
LPASELGRCYAHEHLILDQSPFTEQHPEFSLPSVDRAADEVNEARAAGLEALVDATPCWAGRNPEKLLEVSKRCRVRIVAATGLYLRSSYPPESWPATASEEDLRKAFLGELQIGIQDAAGRRSSARAGFLKIAADVCQTRIDRSMFAAATAASVATGCAVMVHLEKGEGGPSVVETLVGLGLAPDRIILAHTDRKPQLAYHLELADTGCFLEYDQAARSPLTPDNPTARLVCSLVEHSLTRQLLLGSDLGRRRYWRSYGGQPGLRFLLVDFLPLLRRLGVPSEAIDELTITNPARAFSGGFPEPELDGDP